VLMVLSSVAGISCPKDDDNCGWHVRGYCGLWQQCVVCNTDDECEVGEFCSPYGECLKFPQCGPDTADCPQGRVCVSGKCEIACQGAWDCMEGGGTCDPEGYCVFTKCPTRGTCPEGFEPLEGIRACRPACTDRQMYGACGLSGHCVDCNSNLDHINMYCKSWGDCPYGWKCWYNQCEPEGYCTIYGHRNFSNCTPDTKWDCPEGEVCINRKCEVACQTDQDCHGGVGTCVRGEYCVFDRCLDTCPEGWEIAEGILACRFISCPEGLMRGRCGQSGKYIECFTDEDCIGNVRGGKCYRSGFCVPDNPCIDDADCYANQKCFDGTCAQPCGEDSDCLNTSQRCNGRYCYNERCSKEEAACPQGWIPRSDSLECLYIE
jgi:hypothetical protein